MRISKTGISIILTWLMYLPYLFATIYGLLLMTVLNKPGYQSGEQFTPILVLMGGFFLVITLLITWGLRRKSKLVYVATILYVLLGLPEYFVGLGNIFDQRFPLIPKLQILFFLAVSLLLLLVLILDRRAFFKKEAKKQ